MPYLSCLLALMLGGLTLSKVHSLYLRQHYSERSSLLRRSVPVMVCACLGLLLGAAWLVSTLAQAGPLYELNELPAAQPDMLSTMSAVLSLISLMLYVPIMRRWD